jgi:DNA-directed RNA polymerase specialized sigma54-like protein
MAKASKEANPLITAIAGKVRKPNAAALPDRMTKEQRRQFFGVLRHLEQLQQTAPHTVPSDRQLADVISEQFGFKVSRQAIQQYRKREHDWSQWPESAG